MPDIWPFTIASPWFFLAVYAGLGVALLAGARLAQQLLGATGTSSPRPAVAGLRAEEAPRDEARALVPRTLDDVLALAYLRGGAQAVARTLRAGAIAQGWLRLEPTGAVRWVADARPREPVLTHAHGETGRLLQQAGVEPRRLVDLACALVARGEVARLFPQWAARGLVRGAADRALSGAIALAVGGLWGAVGFVKAADVSVAGTAAWTVLVLIAALVALAGVVLAISADPRTPAGRRLLAEATEATVALRQDVAARRATEPLDVMLAVALDGSYALRGWPHAAPAERAAA